MRDKCLGSLLDLWTVFLDRRFGELLLDVVLVTFSFSFSLSPLPNMNPAPRPSGMPDRLAGHSCPALRNKEHGYLEGIRKKDMAYMTTR